MSYAILGIPVRRIIRLSAVVALGGTGCGQCLKNLRDHPGTATKIIKYSTFGGVTGGLVGVSVGLWIGRRTLMLVLTQSMYGYILSGVYFNVRSTLSNKKYTLPNSDKPLNEIVLSSVSGGILGMIQPILFNYNPIYISTGCTFGILAGFIGHLGYEKFLQMRLEFLFRQQYPDLIEQHREAEDYMVDRQRTDYYYSGPIKGNPEWMDKVKSLWGNYGKRGSDGEIIH